MASGTPRDSLIGLKAGIWTLVLFPAVFLALRLYCKRFVGGRCWHWDDAILFASWVALLGNGAINTVLPDLAPLPVGPLTGPPPDTAALLAIISLTLAIASQSLSKTSFAITLLRISSGRTRHFIMVAVVIMNVLFGLGGLFFWVSCKPLQKAWRPSVNGTCWDPWINAYFGVVVSVTAGVIDLILAAIPWKIILPLQLSRTEKVGCIAAMSMGAFAGIAAFIKAAFLPSSLTGGGGADKGMALLFCGLAEPAVSIMATSIPAMRVLFSKITKPKQLSDDYSYGRGSRGAIRV